MKRVIIFLFSFFAFAKLDAQKDENKTKEAEITYTMAEKMPEYPGGMEALYKLLSNNIKFPETCLRDKAFLECKVFVKFIVNKEGYAVSFEVIKGCTGYPECDVEALRVLSQMERWTPGSQKGEAVNVYFTLPIRFKK